MKYKKILNGEHQKVDVEALKRYLKSTHDMEKNFEALKKLEESLWQDETRLDLSYMEQILTPDFFEFGRSGRIYTREDTLAVPAQKTKAVLTQFKAHVVDTHTVLVTYISEVLFCEDGEVEKANRSSLWLKTSKGWQIRFHQGTPIHA